MVVPDPGSNKITANGKKHRIFMFGTAGCSLFRAEGFFCRLCILYGDIGISKYQFLIKEIQFKFLVLNFFEFYIIKPWIRILDPDSESGSAIRKQIRMESIGPKKHILFVALLN
jgi:hypothetical protein